MQTLAALEIERILHSVPPGLFAVQAGMAELYKVNLGHGIYAIPQDNLPPQLTVAGVSANADALTEILVRVQDSRCGVAYRSFQLDVTGGNSAPVIGVQQEITLQEG